MFNSTFKRVLSACLSLFFVFVLFPPVAVSAAEEDEFEFRRNVNGYTLNKYKNWKNAQKVIEIPEEYNDLPVTEIGVLAFANSVGLEEVIIPSSVKKINDGAFNGCKNLTTVEMSSGIVEIGGIAFSGCPLLKSVALPESVEILGVCAFANCTNLKSIELPKKLKKIEAQTFVGCASLQSLMIPDGVAEIDPSAFIDCLSISEFKVSGNNVNFVACEGVLFNADKSSVIAFPAGSKKTEYSIPFGVKCIGEWAFYCCKNLKSIIIPNSVTQIGERAFEYCESLKTVEIPDYVTKICLSSFGDCIALTSIKLPRNLRIIDDSAFSGCESIKEFSIPEGVEVVGNNAFYNTGYYNDKTNWENGVLYNGSYLINAKNEDIPNNYVIKSGTTVLADYSFYMCNRLNSVKIPDGVITIGKGTFACCENLEKVAMPDTVIRIRTFAFANCEKVLLNRMSRNIESIGQWAFDECNLITEIELPDSLTVIYDDAFSGLKTVGAVKNSYAYNWAVNNGYEVYEISCTHHYFDKTLERKGSCESGALWRFVCKTCGNVWQQAEKENGHIFDLNGVCETCGFSSLIIPKTNTKIYKNDSVIYTKQMGATSIETLVMPAKGVSLMNVCSNGSVFGSGSVICAFYDGVLDGVYTVALSGDLNGDGVCDVLDAMLCEKAVNGHTELKTYQKYAANGGSADGIDISSYQRTVNEALK